jgi:hypothetical protein
MNRFARHGAIPEGEVSNPQLRDAVNFGKACTANTAITCHQMAHKLMVVV